MVWAVLDILFCARKAACARPSGCETEDAENDAGIDADADDCICDGKDVDVGKEDPGAEFCEE